MTEPAAWREGRPGEADGHRQASQSRNEQARMRFVSWYVVAIVVAAVTVLMCSWSIHPLTSDDVVGLLVLLALGAASARMRDVETESQIDLSFTAAILLCAIPLLGPFGAALIGALIPLFDLRRAFSPPGAFNAAMTSLVGGVAGLAYVGFGGWLPVPPDATGRDLLGHVAVPLVGADIVLCLVNVAVLAGMIWLNQPAGARLPLEPFIATLPLYLGYALTGFAFVVLWRPGGVGPLTAVFLVAPLVVARWAYAQYIDQSQSRSRILLSLGAAGNSRDGSGLRAARIDWLVRRLEAELGLTGRASTTLRNACALHDIGTVAVPQAVLSRRPDDLTAAQLRTVASHAVTGSQVLRDIDFLEEAAQVVRHHHERWDGLGYPDRLAGSEIPLAARVLAVVDAYEALAWPMGEREPARHDDALRQITARSGSQFDPEVVAALVAVMCDPAGVAGLLAVTFEQDASPFHLGRRARPRLRHAHPRVSDLLAHRVDAPVGQGAPVESRPPEHREPRGTGRWLSTLGDPLRGRSVDAPTLLTLIVVGLVLLAAVIVVQGDQPRGGEARRAVLLVYLATLVVAEQFRLRIRGRLETAPTAAAAGIALALTGTLPGVAVLQVTTWQILGVVVLAQTVDWMMVRRRLPAAERLDAVIDAAIRSGSVVLLSVAVRDIPWSGAPLLLTLADRPEWWQALVLTSIVIVVLLLEIPSRAFRRAETERTRWRTAIPEELRGSIGLGSAMAGTGVILAIAEHTLGLIAVPLLLLPLAITQLAVRRQAWTQLAYLQSVQALSRMPEIAGLVRAGHARRVAAVAVALGRAMNLREGAVLDLEYAALLHDIGQVTLRRPIPHGATILAAPADQDRIARDGARIIEHAGRLESVAQIVRNQAIPYHQVMGTRGTSQLSSRIVKVANAFDDYLAGDPGSGALGAVERLYLGLGHEFDPRVVRALEAHVRRYGDDLLEVTDTDAAHRRASDAAAGLG